MDASPKRFISGAEVERQGPEVTFRVFALCSTQEVWLSVRPISKRAPVFSYAMDVEDAFALQDALNRAIALATGATEAEMPKAHRVSA